MTNRVIEVIRRAGGAASAAASAVRAETAALNADTDALAAAASASAAAASALSVDAANLLTKVGNLAGLSSPATARANLGATATGGALFTAADAAAGRTALGASRDWTEVGPLSTSSGTAFDVTNIPDGVAEIVIIFNSVSLSGTDGIIVQLGAPGQALETVDYYSGRGTFSGTTIPTPGIVADDVNAGLVVRAGAATAGIVGVMSLVRGADVSQWFYTLLASIDGTTMQIGAGRKTMSTGRVDRFRITRTGSNTFDQGFISARYR